ncbi:hypothetical protein ACFIOY_23825 [Bradyrhizobium sp. TZ2]
MKRPNMRHVLKSDPIKLMRALASIKTDGVHIPAFMADSSAIGAFSMGWRGPHRIEADVTAKRDVDFITARRRSAGAIRPYLARHHPA